MTNLLGLKESEAEDISDELVKLKIKLFARHTMFGLETYGLEYLLYLHRYLFGDIYLEAGTISSRIEKEEYQIIDEEIKEIVATIIYLTNTEDISYIVYRITDLIDTQIFIDGNHRTIYTFFDVIIDNFNYENNPVYEELKLAYNRSKRAVL